MEEKVSSNLRIVETFSYEDIDFLLTNKDKIEQWEKASK